MQLYKYWLTHQEIFIALRVAKLKFGIYLPRSSVLRRLKKCLIKLETTAPRSFVIIIIFFNKPSDLCLGLNETWREIERERVIYIYIFCANGPFRRGHVLSQSHDKIYKKYHVTNLNTHRPLHRMHWTLRIACQVDWNRFIFLVLCKRRVHKWPIRRLEWITLTFYIKILQWRFQCYYIRDKVRKSVVLNAAKLGSNHYYFIPVEL